MFKDYNLLLENMSEAVLLTDVSGLIMYCNASVFRVTGYDEKDLLNKPISVLNQENDDFIRSDYELDVALKEGRFVSQGWKSKREQGQYWGEMVITPAYDRQGVHRGYCFVLRDISERKKDELQLLQSEERYRLMIEGVKDYSIFMLDPDGNILTWNDGGREISGYLASEIIGKHFSIFYTGQDLANNKPGMELEIAVQNGMYEEEGWRVKKNGSVFWASVVVTALFNQENKLIGFSKVTRDLSDRLENEETLRQSEARYRSLVEQVLDYGIFMMDEKGRIVSWNEGASKIKGYSAQEIIGKYFSIFYPEEDIISGKPANELKVARAEGRYEEEGWRLRKDGSRFWANIIITAVYNTDKALIGFSKVTRDLTERKKNEQLLKDSNLGLQKLANELQTTNFELSLANQELEQFTSIVSHDLQEPIRTIQGFLRLIDAKLDQVHPEDLKVYVAKSARAAKRMKQLIENLLHYSQISKMDIIFEPVLVKEVIDQALQNLKFSTETSDAKIEVNCQVDVVNADPSQLIQLVQNLVSNAMKFVDGRSPDIKISINQEGDFAKFAVSDNGIGMATGDLEKVFEVFKRLHTIKDYPGTGIGLAICKKIAERHQGKIWCESERGSGTIFYFTIYNKQSEAEAHEQI
jgi:PAS domain S-box-containing protein